MALGQDTTMLRAILNRTANRAGTELDTQPSVQATPSSLIGELDFEIGNFDQAQMDEAFLTLDRRLYGRNSLQTADALTDLGLVLARKGKLQDSEELLKRAASQTSRAGYRRRREVASLLNYMADVYARKREDSMRRFRRESLAMRQQLCTP